MAETSNSVDSLLAETFTLVLKPTREPGTSNVTWHTTKATATGPLAERVARKLGTVEKLIQTYGGVRVKMDIDRYKLWTDGHDVAVRDLWATYARYPYLPRLNSSAVLDGAISDGTSNLRCDKGTFADGDAHDGDTWVGVHTGEHVTPTPGGLLIAPEFAPTSTAKDDDADVGKTGKGRAARFDQQHRQSSEWDRARAGGWRHSRSDFQDVLRRS